MFEKTASSLGPYLVSLLAVVVSYLVFRNTAKKDKVTGIENQLKLALDELRDTRDRLDKCETVRSETREKVAHMIVQIANIERKLTIEVSNGLELQALVAVLEKNETRLQEIVREYERITLSLAAQLEENKIKPRVNPIFTGK